MTQEEGAGALLDLVVLVADKSMHLVMDALLTRRESLGIRDVAHEVYVHPGHDPGVYRRAHEFLRAYSRDFGFALVMFDREGCGSTDDADTLSNRVQTQLDASGWGSRSVVIVPDPELEVWVWSDSPEIAEPLAWESREALVSFLEDRGLWQPGTPKPARPKEALEEALRESRTPRSASIYRKLAERVGIERCTDQWFARLKECLREWFPPSSEGGPLG